VDTTQLSFFLLLHASHNPLSELASMGDQLIEWREGIEGAKHEDIRALLGGNAALLWQPLPFNCLNYPKTMTHFNDNSNDCFRGVTISEVYGIQLLMFNIFERSLSSKSDEATLLSSLVEVREEEGYSGDLTISHNIICSDNVVCHSSRSKHVLLGFHKEYNSAPCK
jgi:hypothetical protein